MYNNVATFSSTNSNIIDIIEVSYENESLFNALVPCSFQDRINQWNTLDDIIKQDCGMDRIDENTIILKFHTYDDPPIIWYTSACLNYEEQLHIIASYEDEDEYNSKYIGQWSDTEIHDPTITISYDGTYPNLCRGNLIINIDGKNYSNIRLRSGGKINRCKSGRIHTFTNPWEVIFPQNFSWDLFLRRRISDMINNQIPHGCCGGCA